MIGQVTKFLRLGASETPQEKAKRIGVPCIPEKPIAPEKPSDQGTIAICGACGVELQRVMCYSCPRANCPVFAKVACHA